MSSSKASKKISYRRYWSFPVRRNITDEKQYTSVKFSKVGFSTVKTTHPFWSKHKKTLSTPSCRGNKIRKMDERFSFLLCHSGYDRKKLMNGENALKIVGMTLNILDITCLVLCRLWQLFYCHAKIAVQPVNCKKKSLVHFPYFVPSTRWRTQFFLMFASKGVGCFVFFSVFWP